MQLAGAPGAVDQGLFANLHAYVQINSALAPIAERLQLKRLVPMAVDQAIVEIITPVVERSATIACMTAQELIVKVSQAILQRMVVCLYSHNGVVGADPIFCVRVLVSALDMLCVSMHGMHATVGHACRALIPPAYRFTLASAIFASARANAKDCNRLCTPNAALFNALYR